MNYVRIIRRVYIALISMLGITGIMEGWSNEVGEIEVVLDKTPYAILLKELIGLSDSIVLLRRRMEPAERRFVEDSILGNIVRLQHMLQSIAFTEFQDEEIEYLRYWIALAKAEVHPGLMYENMVDLERRFEEIEV